MFEHFVHRDLNGELCFPWRRAGRGNEDGFDCYYILFIWKELVYFVISGYRIYLSFVWVNTLIRFINIYWIYEAANGIFMSTESLCEPKRICEQEVLHLVNLNMSCILMISISYAIVHALFVRSFDCVS